MSHSLNDNTPFGPNQTLLQESKRSVRTRRRIYIWAVALLLVVVALIFRPITPGWEAPNEALPIYVVFSLFFAALFCEFIDSSLGMGYGTTLTPILLLLGFEPLQVVPAVLCSECLTGFTAGLFHHHDGNVDLIRDRQVRGTVILLSLLSVVGTIAAVTLALRVPKFWLTAIIAIIILSVGIIILATVRKRLPYRRRHILAIGAVAAFNKALSGGGYGPLVTSGQVVSGISAKHAVAITSLAESLTCFVGLTAYMLVRGQFAWSLAVPMTLGALMSVPMATLCVRQIPENFIRASVGVTTCALGILTLIKLVW
ncbi:MAG: sulfite exporter TauE/SafE family protein [Planctomycetota bacterium]